MSEPYKIPEVSILKSEKLVGLRDIAKKAGMKGLSNKKKADVLQAIIDERAIRSKKSSISIPTRGSPPPKPPRPVKKKDVKLEEQLINLNPEQLSVVAEMIKVSPRSDDKSDVIDAILQVNSEEEEEEVSNADLPSKRVVELVPIAKDLGVKKMSTMSKKMLIQSIIDARVQKQSGVLILNENLCIDDDGNKKCPGEVCDTETGKCRKKIRSGRPLGEAALKKKIGSKYHYNEKYGLVGKREDVMKHMEILNLDPSAVVEKSVTVPAQIIKKRCDDKDAKPCDTGNVCNMKSGRCIAESTRNLRNAYLLEIDGRRIIGDKLAIEGLQKTLGGIITVPGAKKEVESKQEAEILPTTKRGMEKRIELKKELQDSSVSELEKILAEMELTHIDEKKSPPQAVEPPRGPRKTSLPRVQEMSDKTRQAFMECISSL